MIHPFKQRCGASAYGLRLAAVAALCGLSACQTLPPPESPPTPVPAVEASPATPLPARRATPAQPDDAAVVLYADIDNVRTSALQDGTRRLSLPLAGGDVEWAVRGANDHVLPLVRGRDGGGALRIAVVNGGRYSLVFRNLSTRAYEVVATVDGLDVLSNEPGSLQKRGYLLAPLATLTIEGFGATAKPATPFRFALPGPTYAANPPAGTARNIGVLGAALFRLDHPAPDAFPGDQLQGSAPPPSAAR